MKTVFWKSGTMQVVNYHTCEARSVIELDKMVNEHIEHGFELYGSPYFCPQRIEGDKVIAATYCQAFVD